MIQEVVPNGTKVMYHGSIETYHGEMTVEGNHESMANDDTTRYILKFGPGFNDYLQNVRRASFTALVEGDSPRSWKNSILTETAKRLRVAGYQDAADLVDPEKLTD